MSGLKRRDECLTYLLTKGVQLDAQDVDGHTALHHAVVKENPKLVYQLLMAGARMDLRNSMHKTAYEVALESQEATVIGLFVS